MEPALQPRYSVLIPAYNEERLLPRTLASVRESFAAAGIEAYEIVVCDNNSTDRTAAVAGELGAQVVFEPHNQIARARNAAAERARGEWLLFLDADTLLPPALLVQTVRAIKAGGLCGGGSVIAFDAEKIAFFPAAVLRLWNGISATLHLAAGSYIFCQRVAWETVGGFNHAVYAGEELYFTLELKKWGRPRGLRFRVLRGTPVLTSPRKMEWFGPWEIVRQLSRMLLPWSHRRRAACGHWYQRPPE